MKLKKLLAVSIAALFLSACGGGNDSPLGGGDNSHLGGGDYNDDSDDSAAGGHTNAGLKILDCINHDSSDIADSVCYEGTFHGARSDPANPLAMPPACIFTYNYNGSYGVHHLKIDGKLDKTVQTSAFLVEAFSKGTRTTFKPDSESDTKIMYMFDENAGPKMSLAIDGKYYLCNVRTFTPK